MPVRIISKYTGQLVPDRIYYVQLGKPGFFSIKWTTVKGFESYERAKEYAKMIS